MNTPIPITILTGFLGAGKTTLLNRIIRSKPEIRFGLVINEFGSIGIDGQLVEQQDEEIIELTAGCMCCSIRGDILKSIAKLVDSGNVDYIIIETSGVALPRPIIQTLALTRDYEFGTKVLLDGVLCVVDPTSFQIQGDTFLTALEQVRYADIVLFSKSDIAVESERENARAFVQAVNPESIVIEIEKNKPLPLDVLLNTETFDTAAFTRKNVKDGASTKHPETFTTVSFQTDKVCDITRLDYWNKQEYPATAVRAKGILRIATDRGIVPFIYQRVGHSTELYPVPENSAIDSSFSRMVVIGSELNKEEVRKKLHAITYNHPSYEKTN